MTDKISQTELQALFGKAMPLEAVSILMQEGVEVDVVRVQLQELANRVMKDQIKQVIVMRHDLKMRLGKAAGQTAHGSMEPILQAFRAASPEQRRAYAERQDDDLSDLLPPDYMKWFMTGTAKIVARVDSLDELMGIVSQTQEAGLPLYVVTDAGRTEFNGPTITCCIIGPASAAIIDTITGDLKLM
jgi:PTH2 family peptidyl-tRNA hydrolase